MTNTEAAPLLHTVESVLNSRIPIGRTTFYAEVKAGRIQVVKIGRRTYVRESECQRYVDSLAEAN